MPETGTCANCPTNRPANREPVTGPEAERPELEAADPVARGDHQEQRELRVADQELLQPG